MKAWHGVALCVRMPLATSLSAKHRRGSVDRLDAITTPLVEPSKHVTLDLKNQRHFPTAGALNWQYAYL
jgi:hypothetical protein